MVTWENFPFSVHGMDSFRSTDIQVFVEQTDLSHFLPFLCLSDSRWF